MLSLPEKRAQFFLLTADCGRPPRIQRGGSMGGAPIILPLVALVFPIALLLAALLFDVVLVCWALICAWRANSHPRLLRFIHR